MQGQMMRDYLRYESQLHSETVEAFLSTRRTRRNRQISPLLRLPGEIRNSIYGYMFASERIIFARRSGASVEDTPPEPRLSFGLLRTCRQINAETNLLPYRLLTFAFERDLVVLALNALRQFMSKTTIAQSASIQHLELVYWHISPTSRSGLHLQPGHLEIAKALPSLQTLGFAVRKGYIQTQPTGPTIGLFMMMFRLQLKNAVQHTRPDVAISFTGFD
jgi:hypothetical protein